MSSLTAMNRENKDIGALPIRLGNLPVVHSMLDLRSGGASDDNDDLPTTSDSSPFFLKTYKRKSKHDDDDASVNTTRSSNSLKLSQAVERPRLRYSGPPARRHSNVILTEPVEEEPSNSGKDEHSRRGPNPFLSPRQSDQIFARYQPNRPRRARDRYPNLSVDRREMLLDNEESFHSLLSEMRTSSRHGGAAFLTDLSSKKEISVKYGEDDNDDDDDTISETSDDDFEDTDLVAPIFDSASLQLARQACLAKLMKNMQTSNA